MWAILFVTLFVFRQPAGEQRSYNDGAFLLKSCKAALAILEARETPPVEDTFSGGHCAGFVQGVTQLNGLYQEALKGRALFCAPDGVTTEQGVRVIVKYLESHPEQLHLESIGLTISAMSAAFPCRFRTKGE